MNWEAAGAIGEILGAIGVIVTVAYLATQVRQSTKSTNSNNSNYAMQGFNQLNLAIFTSDESAQIWYTGLVDPGSLTQIQILRVQHLLHGYMNLYRNLYHQYREGTFPEDQWLPWAKEAKQLISLPAGVYLRQRTKTYEDLCRYLEQLEVDELPFDVEAFKRWRPDDDAP